MDRALYCVVILLSILHFGHQNRVPAPIADDLHRSGNDEERCTVLASQVPLYPSIPVQTRDYEERRTSIPHGGPIPPLRGSEHPPKFGAEAEHQPSYETYEQYIRKSRQPIVNNSKLKNSNKFTSSSEEDGHYLPEPRGSNKASYSPVPSANFPSSRFFRPQEPMFHDSIVWKKASVFDHGNPLVVNHMGIDPTAAIIGSLFRPPAKIFESKSEKVPEVVVVPVSQLHPAVGTIPIPKLVNVDEALKLSKAPLAADLNPVTEEEQKEHFETTESQNVKVFANNLSYPGRTAFESSYKVTEKHPKGQYQNDEAENENHDLSIHSSNVDLSEYYELSFSKAKPEPDVQIVAQIVDRDIEAVPEHTVSRKVEANTKSIVDHVNDTEEDHEYDVEKDYLEDAEGIEKLEEIDVQEEHEEGLEEELEEVERKEIEKEAVSFPSIDSEANQKIIVTASGKPETSQDDLPLFERILRKTLLSDMKSLLPTNYSKNNQPKELEDESAIEQTSISESSEETGSESDDQVETIQDVSVESPEKNRAITKETTTDVNGRRSGEFHQDNESEAHLEPSASSSVTKGFEKAKTDGDLTTLDPKQNVDSQTISIDVQGTEEDYDLENTTDDISYLEEIQNDSEGTVFTVPQIAPDTEMVTTEKEELKVEDSTTAKGADSSNENGTNISFQDNYQAESITTTSTSSVGGVVHRQLQERQTCSKDCQLAATLRIVGGVKWVPEFGDFNTREYAQLSSRIGRKLTEVFQNGPLGQWFESVEIEAFSQGSIIVDYYLRLRNAEQMDVEDIFQYFHSSLRNSDRGLRLGYFVIDPDFTDFSVVEETKSALRPKEAKPTVSKALSGWVVTVTIIGIVSLFFVVAFGTIVMIRRNRDLRKRTKTQLSEEVLIALKSQISKPQFLDQVDNLNHIEIQSQANFEAAEIWVDESQPSEVMATEQPASLVAYCTYGGLGDLKAAWETNWKEEWNGSIRNPRYLKKPEATSYESHSSFTLDHPVPVQDYVDFQI